MLNNISSSPENGEFDTIVNTLKENIFTSKMVDIFELTFAYDTNNGKFFNRTLFTDFAWLSMQDSKEKLFSTTNSLLHIKKLYIQQARNELLQLPKIEGKSDILLWTLNYIEKIIDLTILGLPFEIEKAGHTLTLSPQEIEQRTKNTENGIHRKRFILMKHKRKSIRGNELLQKFENKNRKETAYDDRKSEKNMWKFISIG